MNQTILGTTDSKMEQIHFPFEKYLEKSVPIFIRKWGVVAHTCNPSSGMLKQEDFLLVNTRTTRTAKH